MLHLRELFAIEFSGGPYDTQRLDAPPELDWPLPETILAKDDHNKRITDGYYEKTWESEGEAQEGKTTRGAIYKWREEDG